MAKETTPNYPDVFGYITDEGRQVISMIQTAVAIRPSIVQAGRPFEVIILIQNMCDSQLDVAVNLQLPEKDGQGQKGKFTAAKSKLVVGVQPAEVGYIKLPVAVKADTAVGKDYQLSVDYAVKVTDKKANSIRHKEGGGHFALTQVPPKLRKEIEGLKQLKFSSQKKSGFLRGGNTLIADFTVMKPKTAVSEKEKLTPSWVGVWSLANQDNVEPLLDKFGELFRVKVLPALRRQVLYDPLYEKTLSYFDEAGYPLTEIEASMIARLMTLMLEFSRAAELVSQAGQAAGPYHVQSILNTKRLPGETEERPMPHWSVAFLKAMAKDDRVIRVPHKAMVAFAYDALLYDSALFALKAIEANTGEQLGSDEEMAAYAETIVKKIAKKEGLAFDSVFMPLVLGGIITIDLMLLKDERIRDVMDELRTIVEDRHDEENDHNAPIFEMAENVLELTLRKYGMLDGGR